MATTADEEPIERDGAEGRPAAAPVAGLEAARLRLVHRGVGERAREALSVPVGPALLVELVTLVTQAADPDAALTAREWVEATVAARSLVSFCQAVELVCVRELDRALDPTADRCVGGAAPSGRVLPAGRRAADELAPALGIAPRTASCLVNLARRVEQDLPAAAEALADGRIDLAKVKVLDEVTRELPPALVRAVEAVAVQEGPVRTTAQLRTRLETEAAAAADSDFHARQARRGVADRDVRLVPSPVPGCRRLLLDLPALHAVARAERRRPSGVRGAESGVGGGLGDRRAGRRAGRCMGP